MDGTSSQYLICKKPLPPPKGGGRKNPDKYFFRPHSSLFVPKFRKGTKGIEWNRREIKGNEGKWKERGRETEDMGGMKGNERERKERKEKIVLYG